MKRRFSRQELFVLRNDIFIDDLIENCLMIPAKYCEEFFRFLCPLCNEFQTATNPKTNLARCFRCEQNFNTIDLMMICKGLDFVESVKALKKIYDKQNSTSKNPANLQKQHEPGALGEILAQLTRQAGIE